MNDHGRVSPTKTVGETTTSLSVGDNKRKQNYGQDSPPGGQTTAYANGQLSSIGTTGSPQHHKKSGVDVHPKKVPQSPPNPFIFPMTFRGNPADMENRTSISAVVESSLIKQSSFTGSSPREPVNTRSEAQPKYANGNTTITSDDEDFRPEVAKLPGRKRVASWGDIQDEPTVLVNEATSLANETTTLAKTFQQGHSREHGINRSHTDYLRNSGESESVTQTNALMHNHFSDQVSSESSSPTQSQRSSVTKNRKSWDGVRDPGESDKNQKVSHLETEETKESLRSCSDSNLLVRRRQFMLEFVI